MTEDSKVSLNLEQQDLVVRNASSAVTSRKRSRRAGVVYLSRVPPGLDVGIVRSILGRCGSLGRVWLRAESSETVSVRRSLGGRRRSGYSDGWVEFLRSKDAAAAVELLNGQPMTGATRRGKFENDLWCLKLLNGFLWEDLVEEVCGTRRERILRVKSEVAAARRERAFVEQRAELSKMIARKEQKELEQENMESDPRTNEKRRDGLLHHEHRNESRPSSRIIRRFRQKRPIGHDRSDCVDYAEDDDERQGIKRLENEGIGDVAKDEQCSDAINTDFVAKLFKSRRS